MITTDMKQTFENYYHNGRIEIETLESFTLKDFQTFSPILLKGKGCVGKTHLLHAIENKLLENNPSFKICFITAEEFTNEYITSIKEKRLSDFNSKYRNLDALFIDDFNYFIGKEGTQEILFFTLNTLIERKAIIVVACEKNIKSKHYNKRLASIFSYGLKIDLLVPSEEAKLEKIQEIIKSEDIILKGSELDAIRLKTRDMRELEGMVKQIIFEKKHK